MKAKALLKGLFVIVLVLGLVISCFYARAPRKPNVVLITIDTLRADHLGCYGYHRNTTPNIDKFARSGTLFDNAVVQIPETLPSLVSIMTGTYPIDHGVRANGFEFLSKYKTLAELLKDKDYLTAAFVSTCVLSAELGIDRGFDHFDDRFPDKLLWKGNCQRTAEKTTKAVIEWLQVKPRVPFFLWVHYMDPHSLYRPPWPYDERFLSEPYNGIITNEPMQFLKITKNEIALAQQDIDYMVALYDGEIAFMDSQVGKLLDALDLSGSGKHTLVVFTADHGESLGEHNYFFTHGDYLYENQLKVPLVVRHPSFPANKKIKELVQSVDITPTILDLVNLPCSSDMRGKSLLPCILTDDEAGPTLAFSESDYCRSSSVRPCSPIGILGKLYSLRTDKWKYIHNPAGDCELYNIVHDLGEQNNVIDEEREIADRFASQVNDLIERRRKAGDRILDEGTKEKLESLGYTQ